MTWDENLSVTISSVISGAEAIEVYFLFQNSEFYKRGMAKINKTVIDINHCTSGRKAPIEDPGFMTPSKRANLKNVGAIIHAGICATSMPEFDQYPEGEVPLCTGTLRDGTSG